MRLFFENQAGAVTSDWIVLSAAILVIVGMVTVMLHDGSMDLTDTTMEALSVELMLMDSPPIQSNAPVGRAPISQPQPAAPPPD